MVQICSLQSSMFLSNIEHIDNLYLLNNTLYQIVISNRFLSDKIHLYFDQGLKIFRIISISIFMPETLPYHDFSY